MFKFLKGVVAGSGTGLKDLPYNIGDPYPSAWGSWSHFRGTSKVIFLFSPFSPDVCNSAFFFLLRALIVIQQL